MNPCMNRIVKPSSLSSLPADVLLTRSMQFSSVHKKPNSEPPFSNLSGKKANSSKPSRALLTKLYLIEQKAFSSNPKLIASQKFFFEMFRKKRTVYSIARKKGNLVGFAVANIVQESFNAIDSLLMEKLKASLNPSDYSAFQASLAEHKLYYLEDIAVTRVYLSQTNIARDLFLALGERGAAAFAFHGRMKNNAYKKLEKLALKNGFRKVGEALCENCVGGEDFMFMLFLKEEKQSAPNQLKQ
ncbi:MAG: hypothetical protein ABIH99_02805 [Candidatus Micrarchaeota archaeon]